MATLVITEKKDAAKSIAGFMEPGLTDKGTYLEGSRYLFTWCAGHLIGLAEPDAYTGDKKWKLEELPIMPDEFKLEPIKEKAGLLANIRTLVNRSDVDSIINCCDPDREGELIFRYVWKYINGQKPVERVWLNTFTRKDVQDAFIRRVPSSDYNALALSGKCRSEADWLLGMNATRALSLKAGRGVLSLGRVQTATLALICRRTLDNRNFVSTPFWNIVLVSEKDGIRFAVASQAYTDLRESKQMLEAIKPLRKMVSKVETKRKRENPPLLCDLAELQKLCNKKFDYPAAKTDETAQSLYLAGVMSYPRTDSRHIGENLFWEMPDRFNQVGEIECFRNYHAGCPAPVTKNAVNDAMVTGHHALLPTMDLNQQKWDRLTEIQQNVLAMVVIRMYQAFAPVCEKDVTNLAVTAGELELKASGSVIVVPGWRKVQDEADENEKENEQTLPVLREGEIITGECSLKEGKTKPPALFTESGLITAMENCGNQLEDKELKETMKKVEGIGRPATRSGIIETLFHRGYCLREKGKILPTELGLGVYDLVKDLKIADPILTAEWESKLDKVSAGRLKYKDFMPDCKEFTAYTVQEIVAMDKETANLNNLNAKKEVTTMIKCRKCGKDTVSLFSYTPKDSKTKVNAIGCRDKECGFAYFNPLICGKRLTEKQLEDLAKNGMTGVIKGFKSKDGKEFDKKLKLKEDFNGVEFI